MPARSSTRSSKTSSKRSASRSRSSKRASNGLLDTLKSLSRRQPQAKAPKKSTRKSSSTRQPEKAPSYVPGMSLDRKLDIAGVVMALVGALIILSLLSANQGILTGGLVDMIRQGFGWGMYLLPVALVIVGLWLVLRRFERIPQVSFERLVGVLLLYGNLLVIFHFVYLPENREASYSLAASGQGGGYIGAAILEALRSLLGLGAAGIALLAWLLIALSFTLDLSVVELFGWLPPLITRVQDAWDEYQVERGKGSASSIPTSVGAVPYPPVGSPTQATPYPASARPYSQPGAPPGSQTVPPLPQPYQAQVTNWTLPPIAEILELGNRVNTNGEHDQQRAQVIEETLASFGAPAHVVEVKRGPTITQFGVEPDFVESRGGKMRVRVSKIASLADDLALALAARTIRIQAPVPGKGYVGIEVPNDEISLVALRDVVESEAFNRLKSPLRFGLGQDVAGNAVAADLAAMPHLLIAGTTGSGKSVCVNSLITCLLAHNTPNELRLIMVDPKRVELTNYNGIPHLLAPVVVELERVVGALQWVTREMDQRYHKLAQAGTRNIQEYNAKSSGRGERALPYLVVFIDELADLMMLAPDETERSITRLAQLARATGIHLVIATQRPSVDVVTGLIKANFPARVAFAVASGVDSRVILDQPGAERLLGRGDMLFQAPDAPAPVRLQGTYVSDVEIQRMVDYWRQFSGVLQTVPPAAGGVVDASAGGVPLKQMPLWEELQAEQNRDPLTNEAIDLVRRQGRASISMLQRQFRIGYTRAARLVENMEEDGIVGPPTPGTGTREVLDYGPAAPPVDS